LRSSTDGRWLLQGKSGKSGVARFVHMGIVSARSFHNKTERTPLHATRQPRHAADAEPPTPSSTRPIRTFPPVGQMLSAQSCRAATYSVSHMTLHQRGRECTLRLSSRKHDAYWLSRIPPDASRTGL